MKKIIISSFVLLAAGLSALAQEGFKPGSEISLRGGVAYTVGESNDITDLLSGAAAFDYGYRFAPFFTLRADLSGWEGRGVNKINTGGSTWKWGVNYVQLALDAKFNAVDIFKKDYNGLLNPYVFVGGGAQYRFSNGAKEKYLADPTYLKEFKTFSYVIRWGVGLDFRINDRFKVGLECVNNLTDDTFNSKKGASMDSKFDFLAGVTYSFGNCCAKKAARKAALEAEAAAATAAAEAALRQKAADEAAIAKAQADKLAAQKAAADKLAAEKAAAERLAAEKAAAEKAAKDAKKLYKTVNVFYLIGKSAVNESESWKVRKIKRILKSDESLDVLISGYADKETGTPERNMQLSEERAKGVAAQLQEAGIAPERISTAWYGDTVKKFEKQEDNRAAIAEIKK